MVVKKFKDKKIIIRKILPSDLKRAREFQLNINSLIAEDAKIMAKNPKSLKEEKDFLKDIFKKIRKKKGVYVVSECDDKILGLAEITLSVERSDHVANFGIAIITGYRGMGVGKAMMLEVIKLAKKELKPKPKIIKLEVFSNNKPAIKLYQNIGFKKVAKVPDQIQYKDKLIDELIMLLYL